MKKYFCLFLLVACGSAEPIFNESDNITPAESQEDDYVETHGDKSLCQKVLDKRSRKLQRCRHKRRVLKRKLRLYKEALHDANVRLQMCEMRERNN